MVFPKTSNARRGDCTNFVSQCMHEGGGIVQHVGPKLTDHNCIIKTQVIDQVLGLELNSCITIFQVITPE
ncbi:amidase domain-containing protein [Natranaerovirga hydrolytica]|uniref:amidase domain-containing protein n=1 Tax=Natranaerovirga hydrolytica TaxID=680378 RepID=UPI00352FFFDC